MIETRQVSADYMWLMQMEHMQPVIAFVDSILHLYFEWSSLRTLITVMQYAGFCNKAFINWFPCIHIVNKVRLEVRPEDSNIFQALHRHYIFSRFAVKYL